MITVIGDPLQRGVRRSLGWPVVVADAGSGAGQAHQVLAGMRRQPGVVDGLEEFLRTTGDARSLEQLAEKGAAAALGGAD